MSGAAGSPGGMGGASGGMGGASGGMGGAAAGSGGAAGGGAFTLTLKSADFMNVAGCSETMQSICDTFPTELVSFNDNANVSPELDWMGVPAGTQSFAVILQDLSNTFAHWVLWNIPGTATMLASGVDKSTNKPAVPAGSQQANLASGDGYFGPGSACNVYEFVVYALSVPTFSPSPATTADAVRTQLLALGDKILGTASVRGRPNLCSGTQTCDSKNMCVN
jgi:Raf kinase inhibitor-like YbhB/YbcL family protein